jgi:hypothetical protein
MKAVEMTGKGKGKAKGRLPTFPQPLETPQNRRAFHIPTASTAGPYLYGQNPKTLAENINPGGGPN